jgi:hypothetical protein
MDSRITPRARAGGSCWEGCLGRPSSQGTRPRARTSAVDFLQSTTEPSCVRSRTAAVAAIPLHENAVKGISVSGDRIFSVCATGSAASHHADDFRLMARIGRAHDRIANGCVGLPNGRFASISRDASISVQADGPFGAQGIAAVKLVAVGQSHGGSTTEKPVGQIEQQLQEVDRPGTRYIAPNLKQTLTECNRTTAEVAVNACALIPPACRGRSRAQRHAPRGQFPQALQAARDRHRRGSSATARSSF